MKLSDYKKIYMSGIGGISMSGIAEIITSFGSSVSGSDGVSSKITDHLISKGINVIIGQKEENITADIDLFVYSAAIKENNPEFIAAKRLGIKMIDRGEFLGELTKLYTNCIGVSGTHGKTTTSSMISCCFLSANADPSIQIGSLLKQIDGNFRVGNSDVFIIESCEYHDSYLHFQQKYSLITNIDNDHLDYFGSLDNIKKSFRKYVGLIPKDGYLIINKDDSNAMEVTDSCKGNIVTYGIESDATYVAKNVSINENGCGKYDVYTQEEFLGTVELSVPGIHNLSNSLGAFALCHTFGLDVYSIIVGLKDYTGAARRMEYKGEFNGAAVYDDYGHHPTEINAVEKAIHQTKYNKSWVVFEPHTFSRAYEHRKEFCEVVSKFDNVIVIDIYAAREVNTFGISSQDLVEDMKKLNDNVWFISDFEEIKTFLSDKVSEGDIVLTLGAGNVTKLGDLLVNN